LLAQKIFDFCLFFIFYFYFFLNLSISVLLKIDFLNPPAPKKVKKQLPQGWESMTDPSGKTFYIELGTLVLFSPFALILTSLIQ